MKSAILGIEGDSSRVLLFVEAPRCTVDERGEEREGGKRPVLEWECGDGRQKGSRLGARACKRYILETNQVSRTTFGLRREQGYEQGCMIANPGKTFRR